MSARVQGIVLGKVVDLEDPKGLGRIRVTLPSRIGEAQSQWAPIARPLASGGFGLWFQPVAGDMVLIAFEDGQVQRPYVLGSIFTGDNQPPETDAKIRTLQTESGHRITLDDSKGAEALTLEDAAGNTIKLDKDGVTIDSAKNVVIKGVEVSIEATGQLTGKGQPIHFNP